MENEGLMHNIKSNYVLKSMFDYIKDKNFALKLFAYSKLFQNKLNLDSVKYKEAYLDKIGFDITNYLVFKSYSFERFLKEKKLNKEDIENLLYKIVEAKDAKIIKENFESKISIFSPLFEIISKTKNYENNYTIFIEEKFINKKKIEDYKTFFNTKEKYSSIYYTFNDIKKINYLKEFNIDFNKIKRMTLKYYYKNDVNNTIKENDNYFFKTLFSFNNIEKNLIYLKINVNHIKLSPSVFENINNFKSLNYLYIYRLKFNEIFTIQLINLKVLYCKYCKNIKIAENKEFKELKELCLGDDLLDLKNIINLKLENLEILNLRRNHTLTDINILEKVNYKKLKELYLSGNKFSNIKVLAKVKFDNLEILNLERNHIYDIDILENVNFKELKELNLYYNRISNINILEKVQFSNLEKLNLAYNRISDINILEKAYFKELKQLNLAHNKISDISILEKTYFKKLKLLNLANNKISDITVLEKVNFMELQCLNLNNNIISNIDIFEKVTIKELKYIFLFHNRITDIKALGNIKFNLLEINLNRNKIDRNKYSSIIHNSKFEVIHY